MQQSLQGIKIVDFSQMMMGPWGTQFLGDMGAEIIKIERPQAGEWERSLAYMGGWLEGESPYFLAMNRNKKSLTLNLKHPDAIRIVKELVREADVVVENFRPGVLEKLGLGYEQLKAVNAQIIYCSGSGYGSSGPYEKRPGQDLLLQAMSGLLSTTGKQGETPVPCGTTLNDSTTALTLALGIMFALFHRERTGQGQKVEVSLLNTAIALQCQEIVAHLNISTRWEKSASGIGQPWLGAPYGIYPCQDGYLAIAMASLKTLGELLDIPEIIPWEDPDQAYQHRDQAKSLIEQRTRTYERDTLLDKLLEKDIWCAPVYDFDELLADPQVQHNQIIREIDHPKIKGLKVIGNPILLSATPAQYTQAPPLVGEHNDEILEKLGYDEERRQVLRKEGVI